MYKFSFLKKKRPKVGFLLTLFSTKRMCSISAVSLSVVFCMLLPKCFYNALANRALIAIHTCCCTYVCCKMGVWGGN
uniref:Uncharacterized protein n=1 Tax=Anguilla anguilla TaxID=7936 RepID=A0A0E9WXC6_ANGAN